MQRVMKPTTLHRIGLPVAAALMTLMAAACVALAVATVSIVGGVAGIGAGALVAVAAFQAMRVPVGRTASRLIDG
jgi:hypothetical protein